MRSQLMMLGILTCVFNSQAQNLAVDDMIELAHKTTPVAPEDTIRNAQVLINLASKGFVIVRSLDSFSNVSNSNMVYFQLVNPGTEDIVDFVTNWYESHYTSYKLTIKTKNLSSYATWLTTLASDNNRFTFTKQSNTRFLYQMDFTTFSVGMVEAATKSERYDTGQLSETITDPGWCYLTLETQYPRKADLGFKKNTAEISPK